MQIFSRARALCWTPTSPLAPPPTSWCPPGPTSTSTRLIWILWLVIIPVTCTLVNFCTFKHRHQLIWQMKTLFPTRATWTRSRSSWRGGRRRLRWGSFQPACPCPTPHCPTPHCPLPCPPTHPWAFQQQALLRLLWLLHQPVSARPTLPMAPRQQPKRLQQTNKTQTNRQTPNMRCRDWRGWVWLCQLTRSWNRQHLKARRTWFLVKSPQDQEFLVKNHQVKVSLVKSQKK